jgi:hypothetical protein
MNGSALKTLQIPTTTRCLEELIAVGIREENDWEKAFLEDLRLESHPVFPLHTEVEGGKFRPFFERLLPRLLEKFPATVTMQQYAQEFLATPATLSTREVRLVPLPGRGGKVASSM